MNNQMARSVQSRARRTDLEPAETLFRLGSILTSFRPEKPQIKPLAVL